jgi:hypothetical protein
VADPEHAKALNTRSLELADDARLEEALAANADAVDIYRELADADPDAYAHLLAEVLDNRSSQLAETDRPEESVSASAEASASTGNWPRPDPTNTPPGSRSRWRISAGARTRSPPRRKSSTSIGDKPPHTQTLSHPSLSRR